MKDDNIPEIELIYSIKIYNRDPIYAQRIKTLLNKYNVYNGRRIVKINEKNIFRVDLVEN